MYQKVDNLTFKKCHMDFAFEILIDVLISEDQTKAP